MRYERTGSGAKVFVGDTPVKASSVARSASFANLQKRLGPYRPAPVGLHTSTPEVRPVGPEMPGWRQYNEQRAWHYLAKRGAWEELRLRLRHERGALRDRQRDRRERLHAEASWVGAYCSTCCACSSRKSSTESAMRSGSNTPSPERSFARATRGFPESSNGYATKGITRSPSNGAIANARRRGRCAEACEPRPPRGFMRGCPRVHTPRKTCAGRLSNTRGHGTNAMWPRSSAPRANAGRP
jgi:hypothetical protein